MHVEDETEWRWKGHKSEWNQNKNIDLLHGDCICSVVFSPHFTYQRYYLTDDLSRLFINTRIQCLYIAQQRLETFMLHKLIEWHGDNTHKASHCMFHISIFFFHFSSHTRICMGSRANEFDVAITQFFFLQLIQLKSVEICVD